MRRTTDSITSRHENCRRPMPSATSHALRCQRSSVIVTPSRGVELRPVPPVHRLERVEEEEHGVGEARRRDGQSQARTEPALDPRRPLEQYGPERDEGQEVPALKTLDARSREGGPGEVGNEPDQDGGG